MKSIILGIKSFELSPEERDLFTKFDPLGYIIFKRNIQSESQLIDLVKDLKSLSTRVNLPIFIDQEGGRVQRIGPNLGITKYPAAKVFGDLAENNLNSAKELCRINYFLLGKDLQKFGINVNCAPCVDILHEDAHSVIGDRSFGSDPLVVAELGKSAIFGLKEAGVMPIMKHFPGHGLSTKDSHHELPVVHASLEELEAKDFVPFKELSSHADLAMTAHIVYEAIDAENPLTLSKKGIDFLREKIGFDKLIISDDLGMKALNGEMEDIGLKAFQAGCDILLHCNGDIREMEKLLNLDIALNDKVKEVFLEPQNPFVCIEGEQINMLDRDFLIGKLQGATGFSYEC